MPVQNASESVVCCCDFLPVFARAGQSNPRLTRQSGAIGRGKIWCTTMSDHRPRSSRAGSRQLSGGWLCLDLASRGLASAPRAYRKGARGGNGMPEVGMGHPLIAQARALVMHLRPMGGLLRLARGGLCVLALLWQTAFKRRRPHRIQAANVHRDFCDLFAAVIEAHRFGCWESCAPVAARNGRTRTYETQNLAWRGLSWPGYGGGNRQKHWRALGWDA